MHADDDTALPIGEHVDAYEIVDRLGRGGFGITYKVFDQGLNSHFALKEFFPADLVARDGSALRLLAKNRADADYQWARRKFLDEARLLAQLSHPNIVNVCRVLEANNTVYMLLDFIPGGTLESWLQKIGGPPTQEELDLIAGPLLSALELVHHNGMCHLDVAPDNVLIRSSDGAPILLDFGAARLEIKQRSQLVSAMLFKSGYSAPEQYTSSANRYGPWTDIYAAGATLYRAIAGNRPIESTERSLKDQLRPATAIGSGRYRESIPARDRCGPSAASGGAPSDSRRMARTASGRRTERDTRIRLQPPASFRRVCSTGLPLRAAAPPRAGSQTSPSARESMCCEPGTACLRSNAGWGWARAWHSSWWPLQPPSRVPSCAQGPRPSHLRPPLQAGRCPGSRPRRRHCRRHHVHHPRPARGASQRYLSNSARWCRNRTRHGSGQRRARSISPWQNPSAC